MENLIVKIEKELQDAQENFLKMQEIRSIKGLGEIEYLTAHQIHDEIKSFSHATESLLNALALIEQCMIHQTETVDLLVSKAQEGAHDDETRKEILTIGDEIKGRLRLLSSLSDKENERVSELGNDM